MVYVSMFYLTHCSCGAYAFFRLCNQRLLRSFRLRFIRNGGHRWFVFESLIATLKLTPAYAFFPSPVSKLPPCPSASRLISHILSVVCFHWARRASIQTSLHSCSLASHLILRYPDEPEPPEPSSKESSTTPPPPPPDPPNSLLTGS